jgi:hypothetical protein
VGLLLYQFAVLPFRGAEHWQVVVVPLRVNANLKCSTVEDLIARRKVKAGGKLEKQRISMVDNLTRLCCTSRPAPSRVSSSTF